MKKETVSNSYDVIILGAGINGCGIARELSLRGKEVLVIDKSTIGSGTSSKSSRLIHGGLRYLETLQFGLVHEALTDREELMTLYPDIVHLRSFYFPIYKGSPRPAWMVWLGLKFYDLLVGKRTNHTSARIPRKLFYDHAPHMVRKNLKAVFRYFDAKTNDILLTQQVAENAKSHGAVFIENVHIQNIRQTSLGWKIILGEKLMTAPILVNATGPWIDEVNERYHLPAQYHIRKISGIHIVIGGTLTEGLMFMQTKGKRIFFIIPEPNHNRTIIGTTEREETVPVDDVIVCEDDITYLIENINRYLEDSYKINRSDVIDAFIGVRPLIAHKDNPTDLSREYQLDLHTDKETKLLHVFGGKLTTFLSLAKKAGDLLF
ncbi:MAG: glycerol-3-phosphate dehydrogenase/oxidase [Candidatus Marinimicrobia bacterium]|nr:glycerol-3-phosphate dehydrogenase/oxidase [Candidatus Neomarinimicrobiota bacterium]